MIMGRDVGRNGMDNEKLLPEGEKKSILSPLFKTRTIRARNPKYIYSEGPTAVWFE